MKIGMAREMVLSGLGKLYVLDKFGTDDWFVIGKDPDKFESTEIMFLQGKVAVVSTTLYPPMKGEAVKLAEHLFFLLQEQATLLPGDKEVLKKDPPMFLTRQIANSGHLDLPVDLRYYRSDKGETMAIDLALGEQHFTIEVTKFEGHPDNVVIQKYSDWLLEQGKLETVKSR